MRKFVQLYSEIGKLNTVILHRPGTELEQLIPPYLEYMLSEDTPYVRIAAAEHDAFAQLLLNKGPMYSIYQICFARPSKTKLFAKHSLKITCR